ncbi:MAG: MmgE/PrpD family protein [Rhodospirillales bacterium]|jgi:2-methylcitrate dehydratase PrpD
MSKPFSRQLAEVILQSSEAALPEDCFHWAKMAIIDTIGVTLAGVATATAQIPRRVMPSKTGPSQIIGVDQQNDPVTASLLNGTAAHALDFDDMTQNMMGHPSVAILPAALALADAHHASGRGLLKAYVIGFEAAARIGRGMTYKHHDQGWHSTGTLGVFGSVAAAASLMKLSEDQTATALAMACSMSSGVRANFGTMSKPLHAGMAGRNGVFAALMARDGFTAHHEAFEHKQGFFAVYNDSVPVDQEAMLKNWFAPPEILDPGVCLKLYPCGAHTHPFIEMTRSLIGEHDISLGDIERIDALSETSRHNHTNRPQPRSGLDGKFSVQNTMARTLLNGAPRLEHFTDTAVEETEIKTVMALINAAPHPDLDESWADKYGGEVVMTLKSGATHQARIEHQIARGPSTPLSENDLRGKFLNCAAACLPPSQAEQLFDALIEMDSCENMTTLTALTVPK